MTDRPNKTIDDLLLKPATWQLDDWLKAKSALKQLILDSLPPKHVCADLCKGQSKKWTATHNDITYGWNSCLQESIDRIERLFG